MANRAKFMKKLGKAGRITIPEDVRWGLGISEGDLLDVTIKVLEVRERK